jgi:hypothetical protein
MTGLHTCMHPYKHAHASAHVFTHVHTCTHKHARIHTHARTHTHAHRHTQASRQAHTHAHTHARTHTHTQVPLCMEWYVMCNRYPLSMCRVYKPTIIHLCAAHTREWVGVGVCHPDIDKLPSYYY